MAPGPSAPAPPGASAHRSALLPARARHGRPRRRDPRHGITWVLVAVGVALLAASAVVAVGTAPRHEAPPQAAVPVLASADAPLELEIPTLDLAVAVRPVGLTAERHLEVPAFGESGWYRPGPMPGQVGHAVIAGHVDSRTGPDVFSRLHTLDPGDEVRVRMSTGSVLSFRVDEVGRQPKEALPDSAMWRPSDRPHLALLTCGGSFDDEGRTYRDNVVVIATMA